MSQFFSPKPLVWALATGFCAMPALSFAASPLSMGGADVCRASQPPRHFVQPPVQTGEESAGQDVTRVVADQVDGQSQTRVQAQGNVIVERNSETLNADWADYDQNNQIIKVGDQFTLDNGQGRISGQHLTYDMEKSSGVASPARFEIDQNNRRLQGVGDEIQMDGKQRYRLQTAKFNTCNPGDDSWYIRSSSIDVDYDKNVGVARNATLVFGGVPVFYTPWIDFPLNGNRKSGFLPPTIKGGSDGFELTTPYYLNLAPNYDATLRPHLISSRGMQLGADFRYLQPTYSGQISGEWLPGDSKSEHKQRAKVDFTHSQQWSNGISGGIDYHQVSDDDYQRDFWGNNDDSVNLNRALWAGYNHRLWGGNFNGNLLIQNYQTLASSNGYIDQPYARLPSLQANWDRYFGKHYEVDVYAEATRFEDRKIGFYPDRLQKYPNGTRYVVYPSVTADYSNSWGYIRPKLGFHATHYDMDKANNDYQRSINRVLPIVSVDTGMTFERLWKGKEGSHGYVQTLEPRLFYTYIPHRRQDDLPVFDSAENSFTYDQLFRENRYSGQDRINAANFVTTAVQTRFFDNKTGAERFAAGIGQRFYFSRDNVKLNSTLVDRERKRSDIVAFGRANLSSKITASSDWHYNENLKTTESYNVGVRYTPKPGKTVSVRYKYGRYQELYDDQYGKARMIDVGAQWPLTRNYYLVARENYDFAHNTVLNQTIGIEYQSPCHCWSAGLVGMRYTNSYQNRKAAILFQLQLRDLSSVGNGPLDQLSTQIPGYSNTYEVKH
ncbi:LPS-assembly protein LptD [Neisseriaceae bacterium ESL0693]|nr:LPS-assembly protein LptD [Neisseriaceae bacterium ESL0693]